jgi:phospholipase C
MTISNFLRYAFTCWTAAIVLASCGGNAPSSSLPAARLPFGAQRHTASSPIKHIVLMIQENRSFNDLFATFPGADGTTTGQAVPNSNCSPPISGGALALKEMPLVLTKDLNHSWKSGYSIAYDGGKLDAFDLIRFGGVGLFECTYPYQYTDPTQVKPYWTLASQYALAEHMFTTQASDSFTAHQDLIRGGTVVERNKALVDDPTCGTCWWGCDATPGTATHLITPGNEFVKVGPFPCSNKFKNKYLTLRDRLDAKSITWMYYAPPSSQIDGKLWSAFDVVYPVRYGPEWTSNISTPETKILSDVQSGKLAAVSWVIPEGGNSDHPFTKMGGKYTDNGPEWIATVVNAIGQSSYWDSTAIIVVWDDWGGFYDNKAGKLGKYAGPGERVPMLVISPYAKAGYISKTNYEFGSILKYIEQNWSLGTLNTTDKSSKSIVDCFNYKQSPIPFQPIVSSLGKSYFMHEKHSYLAPDTDW